MSYVRRRCTSLFPVLFEIQEMSTESSRLNIWIRSKITNHCLKLKTRTIRTLRERSTFQQRNFNITCCNPNLHLHCDHSNLPNFYRTTNRLSAYKISSSNSRDRAFIEYPFYTTKSIRHQRSLREKHPVVAANLDTWVLHLPRSKRYAHTHAIVSSPARN